MVLGSGLFFFNMLLLMYGLQLSIQPSNTDILKLEPKKKKKKTWAKGSQRDMNISLNQIISFGVRLRTRGSKWMKNT